MYGQAVAPSLETHLYHSSPQQPCCSCACATGSTALNPLKPLTKPLMYGQAVAPALEMHLYHSLAQHLVAAAPVLLQQHGQRLYQQGRPMEWTHSGRLPYQRQLESHTSGPDIYIYIYILYIYISEYSCQAHLQAHLRVRVAYHMNTKLV
jgi:hypothetical protein